MKIGKIIKAIFRLIGVVCHFALGVILVYVIFDLSAAGIELGKFGQFFEYIHGLISQGIQWFISKLTMLQ